MFSINHLEFVPLGAGDLIDRTIRLYRRHFMTLVRVCAPPVIVSAAGSVLWAMSVRQVPVAESEWAMFAFVMLSAIGLTVWAVGTLLFFIVMGGASRVLVAHLLWNEGVSWGAVYRSVRARFWGLLGATVLVGVWLGFAGMIVGFAWFWALILVGIVAGVSTQFAPAWMAATLGVLGTLGMSFAALWLFFLLAGRAAYVPQVMLVEGRGIFASVERSITLARGNIRRLVAMFLFTLFAAYSALMLLLVPLGWYGYLHGINPFAWTNTEYPAWYVIGYNIVEQLSTILLAPVWMLGLSLLYIDERVRHEGYDIELMAARAFGEMPQLPDGRPAPLAPALANERHASAASATKIIPSPDPSASVRGTENKTPGSVLGLQ
ncbi:MAG: hypothetical protein H0V88_00285 [Pyrinomonadaceae bacterium]|nr:hypothetical protein [Pyrinomonadaceae bacterium]